MLCLERSFAVYLQCSSLFIQASRASAGSSSHQQLPLSRTAALELPLDRIPQSVFAASPTHLTSRQPKGRNRTGLTPRVVAGRVPAKQYLFPHFSRLLRLSYTSLRHRACSLSQIVLGRTFLKIQHGLSCCTSDVPSPKYHPHRRQRFGRTSTLHCIPS